MSNLDYVCWDDIRMGPDDLIGHWVRRHPRPPIGAIALDLLMAGLATHGKKRVQRERALAAITAAVREAVDRHA